MLVATYDGKSISLLDSWEKSELVQLRRKHEFFCQICQQRLQLRLGMKRQWHFAHVKEHTCAGETEPESDYHLLGKRQLYYWLVDQGFSPMLEPYLPSIKQRPDLLVRDHYHRLYAIEFQCASLSSQQIQKRTSQYLAINITPIWILGAKRMKRMGPMTFALVHFEWLTARSSKGHQSPVIFYYCPTEKRFINLYQIFSYSSNRCLARLCMYTLHSFSFESLVHPPKGSVHSSILLSKWYTIKRRWRCLHPYFHLSKSSLYVKKIFLSYRMPLSLFPNEAGWPTPFQYWVETPAFIWQSWILFGFLVHQPVGKPFQFEWLYQAFQTMVGQNIFTVREFLSVDGHCWLALYHYLLWLQRFGVVSRIGEMSFVRMKNIKFPQTIQQALKGDQIVLSHLEKL